MARTFVIGDIHGANKALKQCLDRAKFDYNTDMAICLGDVCDGWPETQECIDELLKIKNLTFILGNHDYWTLKWMKTGVADYNWRKQGGEATLKSYKDGVPETHLHFLENALPYYLINNNTLFVHAGIDPAKPLNKQDIETFLWSRELAHAALALYPELTPTYITNFQEVYIGHTPIDYDKPIVSGGVWLMDTGAGWAGTLSMMEINTKEVYSSEAVSQLYPGVEGRKKKSR